MIDDLHAPAEQLQDTLCLALEQETGSATDITGFTQMAGGASQETWRFDLSVADGAHKGSYQLVMRRQMGGKIYGDALDLAKEFKVLQAAFAAGVPSPRPYWYLPDVQGSAAIVMQRLDGETVGRRIVRAAELAGARVKLPEQMGVALAAIHAVDVNASGLRGIIPAPARNQTPAQSHMARIEGDLDRIAEPHPALEVCLRWLRQNEPPPDRLVLVHGDYRIGNIVVTSNGLGGVLDWEFAHLGDPAEDLAWGMVREWRFGVDALHFSGLSQPEPFLAAYAKSLTAKQGEAADLALDSARLFYWELLGNLNWAVGSLNQARRHLSGEAPNLEFASLGRRCAEIELEALALIKKRIDHAGSPDKP